MAELPGAASKKAARQRSAQGADRRSTFGGRDAGNVSAAASHAAIKLVGPVAQSFANFFPCAEPVEGFAGFRSTLVWLVEGHSKHQNATCYLRRKISDQQLFATSR